ncbi:MAG: DUF1592 domain-containing protein [Verrucomicrobiota bacterium]|nr:DUF1592 domain-containing protein [Verrucomicrobiota bacterium]
MKQHCFDCHGPEKQKAQIRYDQFESFRLEDRHLWTMVHEQLAAGDMPPDDRPHPATAEKQKILAWIEQQQRAHRTSSTRRLNRRELSAALQDLTGLSVDYAHGLPGDGTVDGFDTGAEGLQDAADGVAQMMQVTRRAVDGIRFLDPAPRAPLPADLRNVKDARKAFDSWKAEGASAKGNDVAGKPGLGLLIKPKWVGDRGGFTIRVPAPADGLGVLRVKLVLSAWKNVAGLPNPHLWFEVAGQDVDYREITSNPDKPDEIVYEVQLDDLAIEANEVAVVVRNTIEVPYAVAGFENEVRAKPDDPDPGDGGLWRPAFDRKTLPTEQQPIPFLVLHQIEIDPDYIAPWPPAQRQAGAAELRDDPATARRLLALWIERAWRRPAAAAEQERFHALYAKLREQKMSFDDALRAAFHSVLLSAPSRYLASPGESDPVVAQHAIASRLSFALVGASPDAELRRLAAAGKLREPAVLDAQVDRLLADPRSKAFWQPFIMQWLVLEQPITVAMSHLKNADFRFARYLKASMREETLAYVEQLFAENRPARELIVSDWTMMNNILARHYGYDGIEGGHLRKVQLRPNDPRGGGILGHAGIQSMLCWMGENWVIYRGAWALRHILDDPPPPPPLEVPELIPSETENHGKTFKELLQRHQNDPKCAMCHDSIDPLGFAFQNFDLSGRWREAEFEQYLRNELDGKIAWRGAGKTRPVDAIGKLPRGEAFKSYAECKELIASNYLGDTIGGLMKSFTLYATGRKPDVADLTEIRAILNEHAPRGYPLRDMLKAVFKSRAFLESN